MTIPPQQIYVQQEMEVGIIPIIQFTLNQWQYFHLFLPNRSQLHFHQNTIKLKENSIFQHHIKHTPHNILHSPPHTTITAPSSPAFPLRSGFFVRNFPGGAGLQWQSCYFKYNQLIINLSMSTQALESCSKRRTSERRRLKLLKNSKEFKITNPYKSRPEPILPEELARQLRKIDFLSSTSISMLSFQKENTPAFPDTVLEKMGEASRIQEERYQFLFGCGDTLSSSLGEELDSQPLSDYLRKEHSLAEEIITTKEEISLNLYDPRYPILENMFDCRPEEDDRESCHFELRMAHHEKPLEAIILEEEYENYFIN